MSDESLKMVNAGFDKVFGNPTNHGPRTAEEWAEVLCKSYFGDSGLLAYAAPIIRRAQLQSEEDGYDRGYKEAIEDCAQLFDSPLSTSCIAIEDKEIVRKICTLLEKK